MGTTASSGAFRAPRIYLDHAASAWLDPAVYARMHALVERTGANPSSVHRDGLRATQHVESARETIAERLGVPSDYLTFTSGGTEANNWALKGVVWSAPPHRRHILVSAIEHPCILEVAAWLQHTGQATVEHLPVDAHGIVHPDVLRAHLRPDTLLVSIMHANNETGVLQDLQALGAICREAGVLFHSDACQSFCKTDINLSALPVDLLTINAHKIHGPKGVGALVKHPKVPITPLFHGGGHEDGQRSGTLNAPGIVGFGAAVAAYAPHDVRQMRSLANDWLTDLRARIPSLRVNGHGPAGIGNIINIAIPGHSGKALFMALDRAGIAVSSSSACHSTKLTPSHVLLAMGQSPVVADEALRVSLGRFTTAAELRRLTESLLTLVSDGARGTP